MTDRLIIGFFTSSRQEQFLSTIQQSLINQEIDYFETRPDSDFLCQKFGITLFPCLIAFKNDRIIRQLFGKYDKDRCINWCNSIVW